MKQRHDLEARKRMVEAWRRSGRSAHEFAGEAGVCFSTLYKWRRELSSPPGFVEVVARDATPESRAPGCGIDPAVEIALPAGVVVRVGRDVDEVLLRRVVRALA